MTMFDPEKITYFAKTDARGQAVPFGIKAKDRQRHMYVVGKTGMGKSTLLENMAAQDIMNGEGMAFIDPHGSAAETLLEYVPEHRLKDVVYFAPFDLDHPVAFNVMEDVGPDKRHLVVSGLMSTFKKIWVDAWSARMEYILTNALLLLIEYPDTTLLSVNRLFNDKAYRLKVVDYCTDPAVKSFWVDEFANYTERFAAEALPAIQNKIGQFTGNPLIRNIIGQPNSSFDIREMMDTKKILIMNLSKGLIGETNANLLGSMLTTRIYLAAMSRANLPVEQMKQMPNFYFYVDEFQSFANATFANILSEARKYHLNLIIAHQYIAQMEEEVRDAVFGNVGTTVSFRVGPFDAEVLETVFTPNFLAADLVNLGFTQIYLTLMIDGVGSQPFSAATLPPVRRPPVSCRDMVISSSRTLYANKREEVEKIVTDLHTPEPQPPKPQKSNQNNAAKWSPAASAQNNTAKSAVPERRPAPQTPTHTDQKQPEAQPTAPFEGRPLKSFDTAKQQQVRPQQPSFEKKSAQFERKPDTKRPQAAPTKSPDDLRSILSKMTQAPKDVQKSDTSISPKPAVTEPPAKSDLKNALAAVMQQQSTQPSVVPTSSKPSAVPESVPPAQPEKSRNTEPVKSAPTQHPTPLTHTRRAAPSFAPTSQNTIDESVVKRMLREEKQDRTPFS
jgi:Type IV secretion-system coupling protein DNA-binding domain